MKKLIKILSVLVLVCFSFYYTEKISYIMQSKDDLMIQINELKENYNIDFINAEINENTIIPGINGISVNSEKSYSKMKVLNVFNEYYLEYDQVKPSISLLDNKDKIIIKGNKSKNAITMITKNNSSVKNHLKSNGYETEYQDICIITLDESCDSNEYKVYPSLIINHQNILMNKKNIVSGDIILIEENVSVAEIKILLEEIEYRDLKIVSLNKLISEENNIK